MIYIAVKRFISYFKGNLKYWSFSLVSNMEIPSYEYSIYIVYIYINIYKYIYIYIYTCYMLCYHENNVPTQLSPQWLCGT